MKAHKGKQKYEFEWKKKGEEKEKTRK